MVRVSWSFRVSVTLWFFFRRTINQLAVLPQTFQKFNQVIELVIDYLIWFYARIFSLFNQWDNYFFLKKRNYISYFKIVNFSFWNYWKTMFNGIFKLHSFVIPISQICYFCLFTFLLLPEINLSKIIILLRKIKPLHCGQLSYRGNSVNESQSIIHCEWMNPFDILS